jgi:hypothetical protein
VDKLSSMTPKHLKPATLADTLRAAIETAPVSRYRIAMETGLSESLLSHFMLGVTDLSMASAQLVIDYLRLRVELKRTRVPRQRSKEAK